MPFSGGARAAGRASPAGASPAGPPWASAPASGRTGGPPAAAGPRWAGAPAAGRTGGPPAGRVGGSLHTPIGGRSQPRSAAQRSGGPRRLRALRLRAGVGEAVASRHAAVPSRPFALVRTQTPPVRAPEWRRPGSSWHHPCKGSRGRAVPRPVPCLAPLGRAEPSGPPREGWAAHSGASTPRTAGPAAHWAGTSMEARPRAQLLRPGPGGPAACRRRQGVARRCRPPGGRASRGGASAAPGPGVRWALRWPAGGWEGPAIPGEGGHCVGGGCHWAGCSWGGHCTGGGSGGGGRGGCG